MQEKTEQAYQEIINELDVFYNKNVELCKAIQIKHGPAAQLSPDEQRKTPKR